MLSLVFPLWMLLCFLMFHQFLLPSFTDDDSDDEDEKGRMEPDVESHQPHQSKRNGKVSIPFNFVHF